MIDSSSGSYFWTTHSHHNRAKRPSSPAISSFLTRFTFPQIPEIAAGTNQVLFSVVYSVVFPTSRCCDSLQKAPFSTRGLSRPKKCPSVTEVHNPTTLRREQNMTKVQPLPSRTPKDYALPNSSWSKDMMGQFNKFMEMCKDGRWKRIPSHRCVEEGVPEYMKQKMDVRKKARDTRFFLRSMDKGLGFEYVMFFNPSQKRMTCIVQLGPYLEGPPGFVHGGSIATMFDATCSMCALFADSAFLTATFTINYKCPVQVGAVLLVDVKVERTEGRKVYLSGQVHSADGQTLYADGTALFIVL
ncbi:acyl-coenzyme A thioesterase THEM4-like, partial [Sphaerodactylus townsendi]|uniref:acyl-coenzyme A thioesterase THEM4-like n=1 Tax=Sphaerodactylus townsendi TaxID=933632 RepID=UPI002027423C